ncbi:hypothetical protein ILYODFUR_004753 [Ilyodon furcidens]|uniref:PH domain-containing protein n=1 Tax=Ilyodon furcidens TaxID=33524 RepID=A0ABV0UDC4_9TELE
MDPFTEKLLERTRARRENLQRKLAERPNAVNRQMVKRPREPLTESNSTIADSVIEKVPQISSKPSPSKRRCSEENSQAAPDEENQVPVMTRAVAPVLSDPLTDKKPPVDPASVRASSSLEKTSTRPVAQCHPEELKTAQPENIVTSPCPDPPRNREAPTGPSGSALQRNRADLVEDLTPFSAGMKSRLQMLAEQRKCWDGDDDSSDAVPDSTPLTLIKKQVDVQPPTTPPPSEAPVGRRGRLANLAATIGSWEDDLSHAHIPKEKPGTASVPKFAVKAASVAVSSKQSAAMSSSTAASKSASNRNQEALYSPVKSSQAVLPRAQKADVPASKPTVQSVPNPLKNSNQGAVLQSSPYKATSSDATSARQSPLKTQVFPRSPSHTTSPHRPELRDKPVSSASSGHQETVTVGGPGIKSFLERFGERCQEHKGQSTPARVPAGAKMAPITPSATANNRLVQERLRTTQAAHTATAELTQRQKMERESELAQIRSRFQKGKNVWENKDKQADKTNTHIKEQPVEPYQSDVSSCDPQDEATTPSSEELNTPIKSPPPGRGKMMTPPASTSSPMRPVSQTVEKLSEETLEVIQEKEMNVDQSINSAVINELFDEVLEQSEDEEEEEEDALNISSMSLLTPLAETVAAVVKSPERRLMTSTPASSFLVKSNSPENRSSPSKFQQANVARTASSSDSVDISDEDHKLPYSIDAYRSIRVKEPERPAVKQVIVRKEDVSRRTEEPRAASLFSMKQKMKILTNEINLQQTVIHQASQALNCCIDEEHGKGSQVEAEAERLLLVATEKREALKAELDCLKGDPVGQKKIPATEPAAVSASKGSITLQDLRLPLKADFVCSTANKPDSTKHSFFIMMRAGAEKTVATPLASTHRGLSGDTLTFPTKFTLSDVSSDFKIDLEVYCLVQKPEICNEKKKKSSKSKAITPKRFLTITKSAQTPVVASPGGPNAVRTSNFVLVGSHTLTLSSIGKNKFPLEKVPFLCPLEGHIHLKMQCEVGVKVEERGFLTMFEDVSGFGAWHRRWCVLSGYCISYWTYPDDEKRKNPIGRINLAICTSKKVEPANREFCARPNTFELITVRPRREEDKETLVSQCMNTMCVTKNWLSADTKDERNLWMKKLNQILVDLRMWQPEACCRPL